jgi:hypothetical protein
LHPSSNQKKNCTASAFKNLQINCCKGNDTFIHTNIVLFQLARGGLESAVYKKLIAPFKDDQPVTVKDGFRRVCADHKYAYFGPNLMKTKISYSLPCQVVPLPGNSYRDQWAFIISKSSPYKAIINWRLDAKIYLIRSMTDN